ncbi:MAG: RNB domain-containing ribonuclease, partial [Chthonomonadales bacterium]
MTTENRSHFYYRALKAMSENGFQTDWSPDAQLQVSDIVDTHSSENNPDAKDLRDLLWSSIDNEESMDLDQLEYSERLADGKIRIMVAIADVASVVGIDSPIDKHAHWNTTSIYTGAAVFPMLPDALSEGLTSLLPDEDRLTVVTDMTVDTRGKVECTGIYSAIVRNKSKMNYDQVDEWIGVNLDENNIPELKRVPGLKEQLQMQLEASERLYIRRLDDGILEFDSVEVRPVMKDGHVVDLVAPTKNESRRLIENLMIAANVSMANRLEKEGVPNIQRIVKTPQRWDRIVEIASKLGTTLPVEPDSKALSVFLRKRRDVEPDTFPELSLSILKLIGRGEYVVLHRGQKHIGHFGLAIHSYTHSTAPNRRFADLTIQRLLHAACGIKQDELSEEDLDEIAARCTERENASNKVERLMRKVAAAELMQHRIGETFNGLVTGASSKGTYVRIDHPPIEGRVVHHFDGMDVGERVRVKLVKT